VQKYLILLGCVLGFSAQDASGIGKSKPPADPKEKICTASRCANEKENGSFDLSMSCALDDKVYKGCLEKIVTEIKKLKKTTSLAGAEGNGPSKGTFHLEWESFLRSLFNRGVNPKKWNDDFLQFLNNRLNKKTPVPIEALAKERENYRNIGAWIPDSVVASWNNSNSKYLALITKEVKEADRNQYPELSSEKWEKGKTYFLGEMIRSKDKGDHFLYTIALEAARDRLLKPGDYIAFNHFGKFGSLASTGGHKIQQAINPRGKFTVHETVYDPGTDSNQTPVTEAAHPEAHAVDHYVSEFKQVT